MHLQVPDPVTLMVAGMTYIAENLPPYVESEEVFNDADKDVLVRFVLFSS